ncbi:MAG: WecB/TagA/CpsF family glycosyltransferase [Deltaproteobacteria bacterium]|nr:WecB/TagA/CpsF family glycosyltransferase [Deltaproteobacteria bacterium]
MSRVLIMGCAIDCLDMDETLAHIEQFVKKGTPRQHVVVNVAKIVEMRNDPELREIVSSCDLINADGMPLVWASRLLGNPLPCRVAGVDLFQDLVKLCAEKGYRPFFFGAREWVVKKVVDKFKERHPQLEVAGYRNGYYSQEEERGIAEMIRNSKADMLFVGFSSPMKEKFLNRWMDTMKVPFCMGVGGSFDIIAGMTKRAAVWMQQCGMEWFYRILQEPRRMWKRYAKTNPVFVWLVVREYFRLKAQRRKLRKAA